MTRDKATQLVGVLMAAYPSARVNEATAEIYTKMIMDLDHETAHRACARLMASSKFMPSIAEIRSEAVAVSGQGRRHALEAWGDVGASVRRFGRYSVPEFDDPIVGACVKALGWLNICNTGGSGEVSLRARFVELYEQYSLDNHKETVVGNHRQLGSAKVSGLLQGIGKSK